MSWSTPSWADIKGAWSAGWKALSEQATAAYGTAAQIDPTGTLAKVQAFLAALGDSRAALDRIAAKLPNPPVTEADRQAHADYQAMERRYHELAAGFYAFVPAFREPGLYEVSVDLPRTASPEMLEARNTFLDSFRML